MNLQINFHGSRLKPSKLEDSTIEMNFSQPLQTRLLRFLPRLRLMVLGLQPDSVLDQINNWKNGESERVRERERERGREKDDANP